MLLKSKRRGLQPKGLTLAVAAAFLQVAQQPAWAQSAPKPEPAANQLPTGGKWLNNPDGSTGGAISTTGNKMQLDQFQQKGIVEFNCFCVGRDAWVNLTAPTTSSSTLLRTQETNLWGHFSANNNVFISSKDGFYASRTGSIEVNSLFATSLGISNADFFAGRYNFVKEDSAGAVVNDGVITVNGYAALAGPQAINNGVIVARAGSVTLAAGDRVSLDMVGDGLIRVSVDAAALDALALNAGTIQADGGRVVLTARSANALLDTVVNNSGVIRARSLVERNGEIVLDGGGAGVVANSGTLDASGRDAGTTGGSVTVQGQHVYTSSESSIDASGNAGGGTVTVKGSDTAYVYGGIDARGTGEGASGGYVETSGHYLEVGQAPNVGAGGTWLIDPYNIEVVNGGTANNTGAPTFTPTGDDSQIEASQISSQLTAGANVVLDTGGAGSPGAQPGNITVNAQIAALGGPPASLTLNANNDVAINAQLLIDGALNVTAGGNMSVRETVTTGSNLQPGTQSINVAGDLSVVADPGKFVVMIANGGQTINARSVDVRSQGGLAQISNQFGGAQTITATGGSIDVQTLSPGGSAFIANQTGNQTITVQNGDHFNVKGNAGTAAVLATNGTQTISLTGSGANQINVGTLGAGGFSQFSARSQNVAAGSINIDGSAVSQSTTGFFTQPSVAGATQTFDVAGTIRVRGGSALNTPPPPPGVATQSNTGIFHNSNGLQRVTAGAIDLQGGTSGNNNGVFIINSTSGGSQQVSASGAISVVGGTGGSNNRAVISTVNSQTVNAGGDIVITGGAGAANNAQIVGSGSAALQQTVSGNNIILTSGAGTDTSAVVTAARQVVTSTNDVLVSGGIGGGPVNGARIGGNGGTAPTATDLTLHVGRDLQVTGGTGVGASIGSTVTAATPHTINIDAGRDVILTAGTGGGVRIGTAGAFAPATGDISVSAGRDIQLNANGTQAATIRTAGNATLTAGGSITENQVNAAITAAKLTASSTGNTSLIGDNRLGSFSGGTTAGTLTLHNAQSLSISGPVSSGSAMNLDVDGMLAIDATTQDVIVTSRGGQTATADAIALTAQAGHRAVLQNQVSGNQDISATAGGIEMNVVGGAGVAQIINNASGGSQTVTTSGLLHVLGGSGSGSTNSGLFVNGGGAQTVVAGSIELQGALAGNNGAAVIVNTQNGGGDQHITVNGGSIRLTGGASGTANRAVIATNGNQTIDGDPDIFITGGSSGNGVGNQGNAALIAANIAGKTQTINAGNITLTSGSGGRDTSATITSGKQFITTTGDVVITGSNGNFGDSNGTRIGGAGGTPAGATDIVLNVGRNLVLNGGGADSSGASIGSSNASPAPGNTIAISAGGDVILNGGTAAGARIGSGSNATGPGDISIAATGNIQLNGSTNAASIRTTGNVSLSAASITESASNGQILANRLSTTTTGDTSLTGNNTLSSYTGSTATGNLSLRNVQSLAITAPVTSGAALDLNVQGILTVAASGTQDMIVSSRNGQTVSADSLRLTAQDGRRALLQNTVAGNQNVNVGAGGIGIDVLNGFGQGQIIQQAPGGNQSVTTSGDLNVSGGTIGTNPNSGIFSTAVGGSQSVSAANITLRGATAGNNNGAFIANTTSGGSQSVTATGTINVGGGLGGTSNRAGISTVGNQTVSAGGDIIVAGGAGTNNTAQISGSGSPVQLQTVNAGSIQLTAGGGTDASATITAARQVVTATGDVTVSGSPGTGSVNGARIGGNGGTVPSATDLTLHVGRDLLVSGGSGSGASIGSTVTAPTAHTISIDAGRDVILTAGTGGGVRIGTSFNFAPATGDISVSAGRDIQLNANGAQQAGIRTAGNVNLSAGGSITENQFNAAITAAKLTTSSFGNTALIGDNRLGSFTGSTTIGNLSLHNVQSLSIAGPVDSAGSLSIDVDGALTIDAATQDAVVTSRSGQTVTADLITMNAQAGHRAILQNLGIGDQTVSATAGGIDMSVVGGAGVAQIVNNTTFGGNQTVSASGALHIAGGVALPSRNSGIFLNSAGGGRQTVSAGALVMEGANNGLPDSSALISTAQNDQTVNTAGDITIVAGSVGNSGIFGAAGRNQDISARNISLTNSADTANSNNSGAFILGGHQYIDASGDVTLTSRASGGTLAGIRIGSVSGGTDLTLDVGGNLVLTGGTAPNNGVGLGSSAAGVAQPNDITVTAGGDVILNGGSAAASGARIGAGMNGVPGGHISITGRSIQLNGAPGAAAFIRTTDAVTLNASGSISESGEGFVQAGSLTTTSGGDQTLTGPNQVAAFNGASGGSISLVNTGNLDIARIAASGAARITNTGNISESGSINAASLVTSSTGSTSLTGANQVASFNGASGGDLAFANTGALDVTGVSAAGSASVANDGAVALSGLWSSATASISGATIAETGAGAVQANALTTSTTGATTLSGANQVASFNGTSSGGDVTLVNTGNLDIAGISTPGTATIVNSGTITESGAIQASILTTTATGPITLNGANQVSRFTADTDAGDVSLRNTSAVLTLGTMDLPGLLSLDQTGALAVPGTVSALDQSIQATGNVTIGSASGDLAGLFATNAMTIRTPQSIILRGSDVTFGGASMVVGGGLVTLDAGEVRLTGGAATLAAATVLGGELNVTSAGNIYVVSGAGWHADALLYSRNDITMTIGGILTINGHDDTSWARVQTERRDGTITLNFPNAHSGDYFVDGFEGRIKHGQDGFFTADKPAKLGSTLFVNYGL